MYRKNWLVTAAGIVGLVSGLPEVWGTAVREGAMKVAMPGLLYITCKFAMPLSIGLIGIAAKGQDEHSTPEQVQSSGQQKQP